MANDISRHGIPIPGPRVAGAYGPERYRKKDGIPFFLSLQYLISRIKPRQGAIALKPYLTVLIMLFVLTVFNARSAEGSWLINEKKFHISAHGQTACTDCHDDISAQAIHPNPADVNKKLKDFFNADKCLSCHDHVMDNLGEGVHGRWKVKDTGKYKDCLQCHKPHYQLRIGENRMDRFNQRKPRHEQCGACHEQRSALPSLSHEDKACMDCHRAVEPEDPQGQEKIAQFCFHCHGQTGTQAQKVMPKKVPLINERDYPSTTHARIACTACHPHSIQFNHAGQESGSCRQCHLPHDEKVTHEAHMIVACEACHLGGIQPFKDPKSKRVLWRRDQKFREISRIHHMVRGEDETSCRKCHFQGNNLGAAAMILPPKSILCMPCHTATFSVGDTTTIVALMIFLFGIGMVFSYWLSGSMPDKSDAGPFGKVLKLIWDAVRAVFSSKIVLIVKALVLDVLFQRRLYRESRTRWLIHSMIFLPFVFRFTWGLLALVTSLWTSESLAAWPMLDKNHPVTAFLFDLTGMTVILGILLAFIRGLSKRAEQPTGLPKQDRLALGLIASIIVIGFILEGMRIAMTGTPKGAEYAFLGYIISLLFSDASGLTGAYGYVWYVHAILTGAFVVYLPFSRMFHIIMAPIVLVMNAVTEGEHGRK